VRLEQEVFSHAEVGRALDANFVLVKLNVEESPATARFYGVASIPTDVIVAASGRLIAQLQSPPSAAQYVTQMNQAAISYREMSRQSMQQAAVAQVQATSPTVAPAGATAPVSGQAYGPAQAAATPAAPAATDLAAAPSAGVSQQAYSNDRYAEYFQQHPQAANPMAGAPQANAPATTAQAPPAQAAQAGAAAHVPPQLPPGCPPLGLSGYCPVMLVERQAWVMGNPTWGVVHRGRTYLFLGPQEKEKFLADPDRYSPVMSGLDPVLALDNRVTVEGKREFGVFLDGRVYLFADEASLQRFQQNPKRYATMIADSMQPQYQASNPLNRRQ
jgi:YHS domain-containing protein